MYTPNIRNRYEDHGISYQHSCTESEVEYYLHIYEEENSRFSERVLGSEGEHLSDATGVVGRRCSEGAGHSKIEIDLQGQVSHPLSYDASLVISGYFDLLSDVSVPAVHSLPTGKYQSLPVAGTLPPLVRENTLNLSLALPSLSSGVC